MTEPYPYILGLDGCSIQASTRINWKRVRESGIEFAYWKASQYSSWADQTFWQEQQAATAEGVAFGAYHFCAQNAENKPDTPELQAQHFHDACSGYGSSPGELPPMIDWEYCGELCLSTGHKHSVEWLVRFTRKAQELWYPNNDRRIVVYTYPYFAQQHQPFLKDADELRSFPLCLASYKSRGKELLGWRPWEEGRKFLHPIPLPWTEQQALLHQYSGNGGERVPGIHGDVDREVFYGTRGEFQDFLGLKREPSSFEGPVKE